MRGIGHGKKSIPMRMEWGDGACIGRKIANIGESAGYYPHTALNRYRFFVMTAIRHLAKIVVDSGLVNNRIAPGEDCCG